MNILRLAAILAAAASSIPAFAQQAQKPQLVVAISVDQFSSQLFEEYRPHFTGGLKRLSQGVVYAKGYQAHAATETCPGHATILTGSHPARSGVVANSWMDLNADRADKRIYCAEDERVPGSTSESYTVSPFHLKVLTLGDRMKATDPAARSVAVAGKDRSAVMMGGHNPDQRWWWSKDKFVTHPATIVPPVVPHVAGSIAYSLRQARMPMDLSALCATKVGAVPLSTGKTVGTHRYARKPGDADAFQYSPELDAATLALAAALTQQLQLGKAGRTDLLAISLAGTDYVGHRYGTRGVEMCLQMESLDRDLGNFFELLDRSGIDYVLTLTADHGGLDLPERQGPPAARVDPALSPEAISIEVGKRLGLTGDLVQGDGSFGDMYIDRSDPKRNAAIQAEVKRLIDQHPQVERVLTFQELSTMKIPVGPPANWTVEQRARASFDPARSGDLVVLLKAQVTPIAKPTRSVATHGSAWDYDRQVPILFWWKGAVAEERAEAAMTVDIMPTLADMIGLNVPPQEIDGRCLKLARNRC